MLGWLLAAAWWSRGRSRSVAVGGRAAVRSAPRSASAGRWPTRRALPEAVPRSRDGRRRQGGGRRGLRPVPARGRGRTRPRGGPGFGWRWPTTAPATADGPGRPPGTRSGFTGTRSAAPAELPYVHAGCGCWLWLSGWARARCRRPCRRRCYGSGSGRAVAGTSPAGRVVAEPARVSTIPAVSASSGPRSAHRPHERRRHEGRHRVRRPAGAVRGVGQARRHGHDVDGVERQGHGPGGGHGAQQPHCRRARQQQAGTQHQQGRPGGAQQVRRGAGVRHVQRQPPP